MVEHTERKYVTIYSHRVEASQQYEYEFIDEEKTI